jgi:Zn finger protein HypA/HybF involved in hydrogenase expression
MAKVADIAPGTSLADYALSLSAGSRCFCCDKPLQAEESSGPLESTSRRVRRLSCPHCGGEVAEVVATASAQMESCMAFAGVHRTAA